MSQIYYEFQAMIEPVLKKGGTYSRKNWKTAGDIVKVTVKAVLL